MILEMEVLINELGSCSGGRKMKLLLRYYRNVLNFSLETEKAKFEINDKIKPMLTNTNILATIEYIELFHYV